MSVVVPILRNCLFLWIDRCVSFILFVIQCYIIRFEIRQFWSRTKISVPYDPVTGGSIEHSFRMPTCQLCMTRHASRSKNDRNLSDISIDKKTFSRCVTNWDHSFICLNLLRVKRQEEQVREKNMKTEAEINRRNKICFAGVAHWMIKYSNFESKLRFVKFATHREKWPTLVTTIANSVRRTTSNIIRPF